MFCEQPLQSPFHPLLKPSPRNFDLLGLTKLPSSTQSQLVQLGQSLLYVRCDPLYPSLELLKLFLLHRQHFLQALRHQLFLVHQLLPEPSQQPCRQFWLQLPVLDLGWWLPPRLILEFGVLRKDHELDTQKDPINYPRSIFYFGKVVIVMKLPINL